MRSSPDRPRRVARPHLEALEGRTLMAAGVVDEVPGGPRPAALLRASAAFRVSAGPDLEAIAGNPVTFHGSATGGKAPLSYAWDLGDGTTIAGTLDPTHTYQDDGTYTATLTATDAVGRVRRDSTTVVVMPPDPATFTVSVRDFGARGDGVTDDAPAIQAALDSLPASGGTVFVPAGDYRLGASLVIGRSHVTLTGTGPGSVLRTLEGMEFPGVSVPVRYGHHLALDHIPEGITISRLAIDGNKEVHPEGVSGQKFGIWIMQARNLTISEVVVRDWSDDGIGIGNGNAPPEGILIERSRIHGCGRNGIHVGYGSHHVIRGNFISDSPSQQWGPSAGNGIDVEVEGHNPGSFPFVTGLVIEDNIIERRDTRTAGAGIALQPAYGPLWDITVRRNLIRNHQNAVQVTYSPSHDGVNPAARLIAIEGNQVYNDDNHVNSVIFELVNPTDVTITGNVISSNMSDGVVFFGGRRITVAGNRFAIAGKVFWFRPLGSILPAEDVTLSGNAHGPTNEPSWHAYIRVEPGAEPVNLSDDGGTVLPAPLDLRPPQESGWSLADGATISGSTPIEVAFADDSGIARVHFFVDGIPQGFDDSAPYLFTFDPARYSIGPHELTALAVDPFANVSAESRVTVEVVRAAATGGAAAVTVVIPADPATGSAGPLGWARHRGQSRRGR